MEAKKAPNYPFYLLAHYIVCLSYINFISPSHLYVNEYNMFLYYYYCYTSDITSINALEDMYLKNATQNLAEDPNLQRVEYLLYVYGKGTPLRFNFNTDPQVLMDYGFDIHKKTKFVAHGWVVDGEDFASPFGTGTTYISNYTFFLVLYHRNSIVSDI